MTVTVAPDKKGYTTFTIELSHDALAPHIARAAAKLSEQVKIDGFRPGHAPYDLVAKRVGEMAIYEVAAENAVRDAYPKAVVEQKIMTVGSPEINVTKLAPNNPFVFTARVAVMPEVTIGDLASLRVETKPVTITDAQVAEAVTGLQKMQIKESIALRPATREDKLTVDMEMFLDHVPIDGGKAKDHAIILSETYYVPGLTEQLIGASKGDVREFELPFPKEHYQKNIAGKRVKFRVAVKEVYALATPDADDAFAASLGQKTFAELRVLIEQNLKQEAERKELDRQNGALIDALVQKSTVGIIPDFLLTTETARMVDEMEEQITRQGGDFTRYLASLKKTREQLALDVAPKAVSRVKASLALRAFANREKVDVSADEVRAEVERLATMYKSDAEAVRTIRSEEYADSVRALLRNQKAIAALRGKAGL